MELERLINPLIINQIKNMTLKQIANISGEFLSYSEFKEYVSDYFKNPREYRIDKRSRYYKEIQYCYSNLLSSYYKYADLFE